MPSTPPPLQPNKNTHSTSEKRSQLDSNSPFELTDDQPSIETGNSEDQAKDEDSKDKFFGCQQCGAKLTYQPGTRFLTCQYCDFKNEIPQSAEEIVEFDYLTVLSSLETEQASEEKLVLKCDNCGAETTSEANLTAQACPFCDSDLVSTHKSKKQIKPRSLLPFHIKKQEAKKSYKQWIAGLWFAPNALKKRAKISVAMSGIYLPHWTYDANTISHYTGQRGVYYYVTVSKTRTVNGKSESYTTTERRTRWSPAFGVVSNSFDDVLVPASKSLPEKYVAALEPWDLQHLKPYQDEYLSGFKAESYQVNLPQGFEKAKHIMEDTIRQTVRRDIGGDEQRITTLNTQHNNVKFKHILLPVWLSAYRYKEKVYRFMVNARTGEVQGERPWSWVKITLAVLTVAAIAGGLYYLNEIGYFN